MDEKFQDRIDDYLLDRMDDAEKAMFLREVEQDKEKKDQLEFTKNVKDSIRSREEKLRALAQFQRQYEEERKVAAMRPTGTEHAIRYFTAPKKEEKPVQSKKRIWLWISGVAAVFVVGFFAIKPMFKYELSPNYNCAPMENLRGEDEIFEMKSFQDSINKDTIEVNTHIP